MALVETIDHAHAMNDHDMKHIAFALFETAIGRCGIAWAGDKIIAAQLPDRDDDSTVTRLTKRCPNARPADPPAFVATTIARIQHLFAEGHEDLADIDIDIAGIPAFNAEVYAIARAIPPGETLTYGDIARRLGDVALSQAVGKALGENPFAPIVPCHRIIAAGGRTGGFSAEGGIDTKMRLLSIERAKGVQQTLFDQ